MSEEATPCLNCGGTPAGAFCQDCGQRTAVARLHPNGLVGEFLGSLIDLETGIGRTFLGLVTRPGEVAREYVSGQRRRYVNPLKYLFFALAVYFLLAAAFDLRPSDMTDARLRVTDGQKQEQVEAAEALLDFLDSQQRLLILAGVPVYAWILGLIFRRRGFNFAEICVLLLYVFAQTTLLVRLPMLLWLASTGQSVIALILPLQVLYLTWGAKRFFDTDWLRAFLATGFALAAWIATILLLITGCLAAALQLS